MASNSLSKTIRAAKMGSTQIITPRLNQFLMQNPNLALDENIADLIRSLIVKEQRDRRHSFSSSAAGSCYRRQMYQYLGIDSGTVVNPQLANIFHDGTWRHLRWQATLLQAGILEEVEIMLDWPAKRSKGSMDGRGVVPDDHPNPEWQGKEFGFELKGMNSFGFGPRKASNEPKEEHLDQVHRYFLSGGYDLFVIIYEDKNTQEWIEWVIEPDPERLQAQQDELDELNHYAETKTIPPMLPECQKRNKSGQWGSCPYGGDTGVCASRDRW